jgi:hypothetical protein
MTQRVNAICTVPGEPQTPWNFLSTRFDAVLSSARPGPTWEVMMAPDRKFQTRMAAGIALSLLVGIAACGLDEHYTGMGAGALPGDKLYPQPDPGPNPCQVTTDVPTSTDLPVVTVDSLAGKTYRFDSLALSKPLPEALAEMVNPFIVDQLTQELINVLLVIDTDDRTAETMGVRLGTGPKPATAGSYAFGDAPQTVTFTFENPGFISAAPTSLAISVSFGDSSLVLPVKALTLKGTFKTDGTAIQGGTLVGAITEADATTAMTPLGSLADVLTLQNPPITPDTTVDGQPAWSFEATFTAIEATVN